MKCVAKSNTTMRLLGPGKYFKDVDFNAEPSKTVIKTWPTSDNRGRSDAGRGRGRAPVRSGQGDHRRHLLLRRHASRPRLSEVQVGAAAVSGRHDRAPTRWRASITCSNMSSVMRKAGVPIVAERTAMAWSWCANWSCYVEGGMTPAEALATATIDAARNVKADQRTGSITVGKEAEPAAGQRRSGKDIWRPSPRRPSRA